MQPTLHRTFSAAELMARFPPRLRDRNKQLVYELCGPQTAGMIEVTRYAAAALPAAVPAAAPRVQSLPGYYDYAGPSEGVWHVNFADPNLFVAYAGPLLAQDELQAAEHPALGSIREALLAAKEPALTEEQGRATPILVTGVERRCTLATQPDIDAGRVYGLYGNRFARAEPDVVRRAVHVHQPAKPTNLIAIAAPGGGRGEYIRRDIDRVMSAAYTGFAAAVAETAQRWPGTPTEIRTGFWGCGAFGGNRQLMTLLQLLAARLAGVNVLTFYAFDDAGRADFTAGAATLERILHTGQSADLRVDDVLERVADCDYEWGVSDGT